MSWREYYEATAGRSPRPLLVEAAGRFPDLVGNHQERHAVDLGCGDGTETLYLLARGWRVLAVDKEEEAISRLAARVPSAHKAQLEVSVGSIESVVLPESDLVYAGLSLFFCQPKVFPQTWERIMAAVRPGGRFAGHLLGDRDSWAVPGEMTFHTESAVRDLIGRLEVESFSIEDEDGRAVSGPKHWHVFSVIGRRPCPGVTA